MKKSMNMKKKREYFLHYTSTWKGCSEKITGIYLWCDSERIKDGMFFDKLEWNIINHLLNKIIKILQSQSNKSEIIIWTWKKDNTCQYGIDVLLEKIQKYKPNHSFEAWNERYSFAELTNFLHAHNRSLRDVILDQYQPMENLAKFTYIDIWKLNLLDTSKLVHPSEESKINSQTKKWSTRLKEILQIKISHFWEILFLLKHKKLKIPYDYSHTQKNTNFQWWVDKQIGGFISEISLNSLIKSKWFYLFWSTSLFILTWIFTRVFEWIQNVDLSSIIRLISQ